MFGAKCERNKKTQNFLFDLHVAVEINHEMGGAVTKMSHYLRIFKEQKSTSKFKWFRIF